MHPTEENLHHPCVELQLAQLSGRNDDTTQVRSICTKIRRLTSACCCFCTVRAVMHRVVCRLRQFVWARAGLEVVRVI